MAGQERGSIHVPRFDELRCSPAAGRLDDLPERDFLPATLELDQYSVVRIRPEHGPTLPPMRVRLPLVLDSSGSRIFDCPIRFV